MKIKLFETNSYRITLLNNYFYILNLNDSTNEYFDVISIFNDHMHTKF